MRFALDAPLDPTAYRPATVGEFGSQSTRRHKLNRFLGVAFEGWKTD
jgi:hypothetical protein